MFRGTGTSHGSRTGWRLAFQCHGFEAFLGAWCGGGACGSASRLIASGSSAAPPAAAAVAAAARSYLSVDAVWRPARPAHAGRRDGSRHGGRRGAAAARLAYVDPPFLSADGSVSRWLTRIAPP